MAATGLICVGSLAKPHGIRGECAADVRLEDMSVLEPGQELYLLPPGADPEQGATQPQPVELEAVRKHKGRLLLTFKGVQDRNAAELLRGRGLWIPEKDLPPPDDHEVYCYQLVGLDVYLPDGSLLGKITDVATPTEEQEIWVIETPQGKEALFPAHPETVVDIDIEARQARIAPPEGLLELYLGG